MNLCIHVSASSLHVHMLSVCIAYTCMLCVLGPSFKLTVTDLNGIKTARAGALEDLSLFGRGLVCTVLAK